MKGGEHGLADGLSRIPVRALDIGFIGKEQSYLSAMTVTRDDSGGFLLKPSDGREQSDGSEQSDGCFLKDTEREGKKSVEMKWRRIRRIGWN